MASNEEILRKCKVESCVFTRLMWLGLPRTCLCMTSVSASVSLYNLL